MTIHNKRANTAPDDAIYIGRPGPWGNPFSHLAHSDAEILVRDRTEAVKAYRVWLHMASMIGIIHSHELASLADCDLVCWCAPDRCHGEILAQAARWTRYCQRRHDAADNDIDLVCYQLADIQRDSFVDALLDLDNPDLVRAMLDHPTLLATRPGKCRAEMWLAEAFAYYAQRAQFDPDRVFVTGPIDRRITEADEPDFSGWV
jgi:hypothetical protein